MLRGVLIAFAAGLIAAGVIVMGAGGLAGTALWLIGSGAVLLLITLYERIHYKAVSKTPPGPGWHRTDERFIDDKTGKPVTVYIRPETGERIYVEE